MTRLVIASVGALMRCTIGLRVALFVLAGVCVMPRPALATSDSGTSADLLGVGGNGRFAVIEESSVQVDCKYGQCTLYVIDLEAHAFRRLWLRKLPGAIRERMEQECAAEKKTPAAALGEGAEGEEQQECANRVAERVTAEVSAAGGPRKHALARYRKALAPWQRNLLGEVQEIPVAANLLPPPPGNEPRVGPRFERKIPGVGTLVVALESRWQVRSYRASTEDREACWPHRIATCEQKVRWVDGQSDEFWVCPNEEVIQQVDHDSMPAASSVNCAGLATMVRVRASWNSGSWHLGRSSLVEPGALWQAVLNRNPSRTIDLDTLEMADHSVAAYRIGDKVLVVGSFAHAIYFNGSWYPIVVALPWPGESPPGATESADQPCE